MNRYAYVGNNPIAYNDPSGHRPCGDGEIIDCEGIRQVIGGSGRRQEKPGNGEIGEGDYDGYGGAVEGGVGDSEIYPVFSVPVTATYHPLDGNVVSQVSMFDYSYNPPKLVGYRVTSYTMEDVSFDPSSYLPIPKDTISAASAAYTVFEKLLELGSGEVAGLTNIFLGPLGVTGGVITCPECAAIMQLVSFVHDTNEAFTIRGHLRTHDVYFYDFSGPYNLPNDFDPFPYNIRR